MRSISGRAMEPLRHHSRIPARAASILAIRRHRERVVTASMSASWSTAEDNGVLAVDTVWANLASETSGVRNYRRTDVTNANRAGAVAQVDSGISRWLSIYGTARAPASVSDRARAFSSGPPRVNEGHHHSDLGTVWWFASTATAPTSPSGVGHDFPPRHVGARAATTYHYDVVPSSRACASVELHTHAGAALAPESRLYRKGGAPSPPTVLDCPRCSVVGGKTFQGSSTA